MRPKVVFFSLNSISAIPVFRLILRGADQSLFSKVTMIECFLDDMSSRFDKVHKHIDLLKFKSAAAFNNQSGLQKLKKYFLVVWYLLKLVRSGSIIYTCDVEVLALAIWVKRIKKRSGCKIVYHQFENIEFNKANFFKRKSIDYIRSVQGVDLAIFPEQNRMTYFANMINNTSLNSFVIPNTCYPQSSYLEKSQGNDTVVVGHIGNLSTEAFYLQELLDGIKKIRRSDLRFIFVGIKNNEIKEKILEAIPDAQVIGWMDHAKLQETYRDIDVGLILYKPLDFNTDFCAPNKLYEYWSHGIPVMAPQLKGLIPVFDSPIKGKLIDFNSANEISEAFNNWNYVNSSEEHRKKGKLQLIDLFQQTLDVSIFIKQWEVKLKALVQ